MGTRRSLSPTGSHAVEDDIVAGEPTNGIAFSESSAGRWVMRMFAIPARPESTRKLVLSEQCTTIPRIVEKLLDYEYNLNLCVTTPNTKQEPIAGS
jgi:hypothetical protein